MNVTLRTLPNTPVAYLRNTGPYGESGIPGTWQRLLAWCEAAGLLAAKPDMFGLGLDNPTTTPPEACRYDACVAVGPNVRPEGDIRIQIIPGGLCACTDFAGTAADIGAAWTRFCRDWLPASPWQFDTRPCFEHYGPDFHLDPDTGRFNCRLCIPVREK